MHLLLIHQFFLTRGEAGGTRHIELASRLVRAGHRVTVIAGGVPYLEAPAAGARSAAPRGREALVDGVEVRYVSGSVLQEGTHRSTALRVGGHFDFVGRAVAETGRLGEAPDLVYVTSPPLFQGLAGVAAAFRFGTPLLFEVRDLWPAFLVDMGVLRSPVAVRLFEILERFLYEAADGVVPLTPPFADFIQGLGVPASRITVIPNGADLDVIRPGPRDNAFREECGFQDRFVALYAGAHGDTNDLGTVIRAAERLKDREDVVVALVGGGKRKPELVAEAARLGLPNVVFVEPQPKERMGEVLAAMDVGLTVLGKVGMFGTVYPNKLFDYMAAARPQVVNVDGAARKLVEDGAAGRYVPAGDADALADAVRWFADHRAEGGAMGRAGRAYVEREFDREALAARWLELVLEHGRDRPPRGIGERAARLARALGKAVRAG